MKTNQFKCSHPPLLFKIFVVTALLASTNFAGKAGLGSYLEKLNNLDQLTHHAVLYFSIGVASLPFVLLSIFFLVAFLYFANRSVITPRESLELFSKFLIPLSVPFFIHLLFIQMEMTNRIHYFIPWAISFFAPALSAGWLLFKTKTTFTKESVSIKRSICALVLPVFGIGLAGLVLPFLQIAVGAAVVFKFLN